MATRSSKNTVLPTAPAWASVTELRSPNQSARNWPDVTKPTTVRRTTPRIEVVVDVGPGEDISAALLDAVRDEIDLYLPVNGRESKMDSSVLSTVVADLHRRMKGALDASAADRGHAEFGAGSDLTDGQRTFRFTGYEVAAGTPLLTYVTDDSTHRVRWDEVCRMLADLAPAEAAPGVGPLPVHEPDWRSLSSEEQEKYVALARHLRQAITGSPEGNLARARRLGRVDPRWHRSRHAPCQSAGVPSRPRAGDRDRPAAMGCAVLDPLISSRLPGPLGRDRDG